MRMRKMFSVHWSLFTQRADLSSSNLSNTAVTYRPTEIVSVGTAYTNPPASISPLPLLPDEPCISEPIKSHGSLLTALCCGGLWSKRATAILIATSLCIIFHTVNTTSTCQGPVKFRTELAALFFFSLIRQKVFYVNMSQTIDPVTFLYL